MAELTRKLNEEELFECLKSLNVPVRLSDIKTPTKDFMFRICDQFLKDLQIDIMSPVLRPWAKVQHLENPDYSEDARTLMLCVVCINYLLCESGLQLTYKDIVEPKPKRTKKILNFIVVFWSYVMNKISTYTAIDEEFLEKKRQISQLLEENRDIEDQYQSCLYALENQQPTAEELNYNILITSNQLEEFQRQQEKEINEYQDLKKREQDLRSRIAAADVEIISKKEKLNDLDQCILTSPEKFTDDISKLKDLIKIEELKTKDKEAELKEKENKLEALKLTQEENEKMLKSLQQLENLYEESCDLANSLGTGSQEIKELEDEMKKLNEQIETTIKSKNYTEDKLIKAQLNLQMQAEKYSDMRQTLQNDAVTEQENLHAAKSSISKLEQKIEKATDLALAITSQCKKAESETNQAVSVYKAKEEELVSQFERDCSAVKSSVKKFFMSEE